MKIAHGIAVIIILLTSSVLTAGAAAVSDSEIPDWVKIRKLFEAYVQYPNKTNAQKLIQILPEKHVSYTNNSEEQKALSFINDREQLGMLERQVISKDPPAVRLAFRLRSIADGGFAEDLDIMLGQLIRIDPVLFLTELENASPPVTRLDGLLLNFGAVYVDREEADCLEIDRRITTLKSVDQPQLLIIRNEAVKVLEAKRKRSCKGRN